MDRRVGTGFDLLVAAREGEGERGRGVVAGNFPKGKGIVTARTRLSPVPTARQLTCPSPLQPEWPDYTGSFTVNYTAFEDSNDTDAPMTFTVPTQ